MKIYCTTCCKEKTETPGKCPAIERYLSPRIHQVYEKSRKEQIALRILSGKYGLLKPEALIPWYDQKLELERIPTLLPLVVQQLQSEAIQEIIFFGKDPIQLPEWYPYYKIMEMACKQAMVKLHRKEV